MRIKQLFTNDAPCICFLYRYGTGSGRYQGREPRQVGNVRLTISSRLPQVDWQKLNPLPGAFSRFGSFDQLQENNNKRINTILTDLLKKQGKEGSTERKLGDFYKLAMDSVRRNKEGVSPVKPLLNEMENAKSLSDLRALQLKYASFGYGVPMGYSLRLMRRMRR